MVKPDFFEVLTSGEIWKKPVYPELDDPEWKDRFITGTNITRKNIANAWVWRFNEIYTGLNPASSSDNDMAIDLVNLHYRWIGAMHSYLSQSHGNPSLFSGSIESLSKHLKLGLEVAYQKSLEETINALWFGDKNEKSNNLLLLGDLLEEMHRRGRRFPFAKNLIQNMAWDCIDDFALELPHSSRAATISLRAGANCEPIPLLHKNELNNAWHIIALRLVQKSHVSAGQYNQERIFSIITEGSIQVAAENFPFLFDLMESAHYVEDEKIIQPNPLTLHCRNAQTYFDILRSWIPKASSEWDNTQAMGLTALEACRQVAQTSMFVSTKLVIPNTLLFVADK